MSITFPKFVQTIPKTFNPETNRVIYALLYAIALSDDGVYNSILEAKKQLFVRTATGKDLETLARSLGVAKPPTLGLTDADFQELIPNLSLKPKTIRKAFYDTADVFWGPDFTRANITAINAAPYDLNVGDVLKIQVDNQAPKEIKILTGDLATPGAATIPELKRIIEGRMSGVMINTRVDSLTSDEFLNVMTTTPGSRGGVVIYASTGIGVSKLNLPIGDYDILDLAQRVAIYQTDPNTLLIEIPSVVPALRRTLKGSHHFHSDGTLESPKGVDQGVWAGSFFYNPTASVNAFTITGRKTQTQQIIEKGQIYTAISVNNSTQLVESTGELIFGFGTSKQEGPVKYRGTPNSNTVLMDPGYTFKFDHLVGTYLNCVSKDQPYIPQKTGQDLAVYLTSPSGARKVVQSILETLSAAGIIIQFKILAPKYVYLLDNPYIDDDNEPSTT